MEKQNLVESLISKISVEINNEIVDNRFKCEKCHKWWSSPWDYDETIISERKLFGCKGNIKLCYKCDGYVERDESNIGYKNMKGTQDNNIKIKNNVINMEDIRFNNFREKTQKYCLSCKEIFKWGGTIICDDCYELYINDNDKESEMESID